MPLILVVEDEDRVASFVAQSLEEAGFKVVVAGDAATAQDFLGSHTPDLVILDLMLPDQNGVDLLKSARESGMTSPVLILSAKSSMTERVSGLDAGADDYLGKPFGIEELLARVRVLLRRQSQPANFKLGDLQVDFVARRVTRADRLVFLSETEYRLVEILAQKSGQPVSKRELLERVWDDPERDENVVEVYISYLRNKLEWSGSQRLLQTVRGKGYMLSESRDVS